MLRQLKAIILKDLRIARRDPRFIAPSLIVPFVLLSVYVILWTSVGGGESFACGLVVQDQTQQAEEMARIIEEMVSTTNHTWFSVTRYEIDEAESLFQQGRLAAYIIIPDGFGKNISERQSATITIRINNANDDIVKNYIHRIEAAVLLYNQGARAPDFNQSNARVALDERHTLDVTPGNTQYAGAAAIILSLITCSLAGQGMSTSSEFENKAIDDTLNSPVSRILLIAGHTLSAIPRSFIVLLISFPVIAYITGTIPQGNTLLLLFILLLSVLALTPVGELIGVLTRVKEKALLASVLLTLIGFLAGGGLAPVSLMPVQFRAVALLIPITHVIMLWTRLFFHDTLSGILPGILALLVTWVLFTFVAAYVTKRRAIQS